MLPIERFVDIPAGRVISGASAQTLGWFDENNPREQFKLRQLRVGLYEPANGVRYTAMITVPGGLDIGPIDIPFRFNVEGPVNLLFTADGANTVNQKIMCTWHDLPDSPNLLGATYFVFDARTPEAPFPAGYVRIPPWVVAVTMYGAATITFYDNAGNPIATSQSAQMVARPRAAEYITSSTEGDASVLFHY